MQPYAVYCTTVDECRGKSLQWSTTDAEVRVSCVENPELTWGLPLKSEVGRYVARHAAPCARNFFFPGPFNFICSKRLLRFFLVLAVKQRFLDFTVYVPDINQPSLPTPFFTLFLCLFLSLWPFQLCFFQ